MIEYSYICPDECPNCGKDMEITSNTTRHHTDFSGTADEGEMDYQHLVQKCKTCGITHGYDEDEPDKIENWKIPDKLKPTAKQITCVGYINNTIGSDFLPLTKKSCSDFIKENLEYSKRKNKPYWYYS